MSMCAPPAASFSTQLSSSRIGQAYFEMTVILYSIIGATGELIRNSGCSASGKHSKSTRNERGPYCGSSAPEQSSSPAGAH